MRSDIEVGLAPAARQRSFRVLRISWADSIPKLLQARLIESFENYDIAHAPLRTPDIGQADFQLLIEVRCFRIAVDSEPAAEMGFVGRIVDKNGKIIASRLFQESQKFNRLEPAAAYSRQLLGVGVGKLRALQLLAA